VFLKPYKHGAWLPGSTFFLILKVMMKMIVSRPPLGSLGSYQTILEGPRHSAWVLKVSYRSLTGGSGSTFKGEVLNAKTRFL